MNLPVLAGTLSTVLFALGMYVFNLPAGPIWALHLAYVLASALMLAWWLRYTETGREMTAGSVAGRPEGSAVDISVSHKGEQS